MSEHSETALPTEKPARGNPLESIVTAPEGEDRPPLMPRVLSKVKVDQKTACWIWQGYTNKRYGQSEGYAQIGWNRRNWLVHRAVYTLMYGPIPDFHDIDHTCERKACCNPMHLEAVTHEVNMKRSPHTVTAKNAAKTHCKHGHEFTLENTVYRPQSMGRDGVARWCLTCFPKMRKYAA